MCTTKTVVEVFENLEIEKTRTTFKWECFRDQLFEPIIEKELVGIEYLNKLIKHTYMNAKQKFEAGLRFTIPGNDITYKLLQDAHGRDYVGFLNSGAWDYAFNVTQVTDNALVYPDGEQGSQKELLFNSNVICKRMNSSDLRCAIDLIYHCDIEKASDELYDWLRPGRKKETLQTLFELLDYQNALIEVLEKELIDLRIEQNEPNPKFYPMSYTPRKRY